MITPNRYHLWAALECHAFSKAEAVLRFSAEEDGMWVQWQDYARLKADAQVILKHLDEASADCARLKAEVERLESMADENAHLHKGIYSLSLNVVQLKAEVERLRKAGDAMRWLIECQNDDAYYGHNEEHAEAVKAWNAAKEGKQP